MQTALTLSLLFLPLTPAIAADPPSEPRKYLDWWYKQLGAKGDLLANPRETGAWDKQLTQLESKKPEEREAAATFLRDVAALSVADETAGKASRVPNYQLPGDARRSERSCTAALLWRSLTLYEVVSRTKGRPELFPLVAWYLDSETDSGLQSKAAEVLDSYTTAEGDNLRVKLGSGEHPNAGVVALALKQLPKHKQKLPADELLALCQHHRKPVREAAREMNNNQGGKEPGPFDPAKAMQSAPMKAALAELQKWMPDVLPAEDAKLVEVTARYIDDNKKEQQKETYIGWLLEKEGDKVKLLLPGGYTQEFTHGEKGSLHVYATSFTPVTCEVSTSPAKVKALVDAVAALRKEVAQEAKDSLDSRRQLRLRRDSRRTVGGVEELALAGLDPTPSSVIAGKELLEQARLRLSEEERQLVELRGQGLSWEEVAASLGGTAGARRNQLARVLDRVAVELRIDAI